MIRLPLKKNNGASQLQRTPGKFELVALKSVDNYSGVWGFFVVYNAFPPKRGLKLRSPFTPRLHHGKEAEIIVKMPRRLSNFCDLFPPAPTGLSFGGITDVSYT